MRRRTAAVAAIAVAVAALGLGVATQLRTGEEQAPPRSPITRTPHPPCDVTLHSGADLGPYENGDAYRGAVVCLGDGDYALHRTQHTAGVKVYALHRYQARVWGWIEAYGAGEEWHGVSFNNCRGYTLNPGGCSNPGFAGGTTQGMQVYADDFVFVDGELTNGHDAEGWFLGRPGAHVQNVLIARNKIHGVGSYPGGTGADHAFYAVNASGQVSDNWLWDNVGYGLQFYPYSSDLHFDHNVVDQQQEGCAIFASSGGGNTFDDNICVSTPRGVLTCCNNAAGDSAGRSWFWSVPAPFGGGNYAQSGGNGFGDPGFVDYAHHDYNLVQDAAAEGYGPRVRLP